MRLSTDSLFVAIYFAIDRTQPKEQPCIWALDLASLRKRVESIAHLRKCFQKDPNAKNAATVKAIIDHAPRRALVFPLNPFHMNRRLVLRQGVFLVPGDITHPFMNNLTAMADPRELIIEIRLSSDPGFWEELTRELLAVNISPTTLFPGRDGFTRNLKSLIPFPEMRAIDREVGQE